jgi:RNA polymerase sigma-70 factor (ECF subfamily)
MQRDLVIRAQSGDVEAFSALTAEGMGRLIGLAADAVQDALLQAWMDLRGLRDPDRFDAWLHRLLVRACYRAAKRTRMREVVEVAITPSAASSERGPDAALAVRDQLDRAFKRLSPEHRAAIVLHHYLGMSMAEAADVLGIPLGTLQSRLNRATRVMRAALDADERSTIPTPEAAR